MATEDLKRLVAREIASGERIADVARLHNYSWKGMSKLVASPDVQSLIAQEREKLDKVAEQYRAQLVIGGEQALENIRAVIENPDHPRNLETSRWVLDKILPRRHDGPSVAVAVSTADTRVLIQATEQLDKVLEMFKDTNRASCEKYTLLGLEGLETAED